MAKKNPNKSNDKIPKDEMLLAEAIAAVKAAGLTACAGLCSRVDGKPVGVCALGAIALARGWKPTTEYNGKNETTAYNYAKRALKPIKLNHIAVYTGNDQVNYGSSYDWSKQRGQDLGVAYRRAMD